MIERQLSIFLENQPGVLADVCKTLAAQNITIRGLSVSDTVDHAVVRLVVSDPNRAIHILGEHGAMVVETDVLAVKLPDQPGELARVAEKLSQARINIEYAYGSGIGDECVLFLRVSDLEKAEKLIGA